MSNAWFHLDSSSCLRQPGNFDIIPEMGKMEDSPNPIRAIYSYS